MKREKNDLRVAVLTTPQGIFTTHYLVRNLNVVGVIIDKVKRKNIIDKKSLREKFSSVKMQYGKRRVFLRQGDGSLRALLEIESDKIREVKDEADEIRNQSYVKE